jgi:membrane-bound lytic murein transglycosylase B
MSQASSGLRRSLGCLVVALLSTTACGGADDQPSADAPGTTSTTATLDAVVPGTDTTTTAMAPPATLPPTSTTLAPAELAPLRPPLPGADPASLAAQIASAELTIRDTTSSALAVSNAGLIQQVAYRQLARHPEWMDQVMAAVPQPYQLAVLRNVYARREFEAMHTTRSTTLPAWHIIPPESLDMLQATYEEAATAYGLQWPYLAAIHLVETGTGRIRGTSSAGAQGPMQFMPQTWAAYGGGGDINSTRDAVFAAARYLATNNGAHDMANALWNYNHSDHYVRGVMYYADAIAEHPLALRGFYGWGIWYVTASGDAYLPIGYAQGQPIAAADYITARPPFGS